MRYLKRKYLIFLSFILIILGIGYFLFLRKEHLNYQINSMIEDNPKYLISATIPKTNISNIDQEINHFIQQQIQKFKNISNKSSYLLERNELNIDFDYNYFNDRYINIVFKIDIYDGKNNYLIQNYLYDLKKGCFIDVLSLFDNSDYVYKTVKDTFLKEKNIMITNSSNLYMAISNPYLDVYIITDKIYSISIPLRELGFQLSISDDCKDYFLTSQVSANIIDPMKPVVALTFDDGPSEYTKEIIDTLKKYEANATFFVLGNKVTAYQDVIRESINNGNEIGNHTYNHKWLSRLSKDEIIEQITKTQNILKETVHYTPTHLRPTYGSVNQRIRKNTELEITLWTIDTKDWKVKNVDRIVERAIQNIEDGDIILMHDIFERSSEAVKKLVPILKEKGFQLITISELEEVKLLRTKF